MPENRITLPAAAVLLRLPYYTAHRLALRGALGPIEQMAGRWLLDAEEVRAYCEQRNGAVGSIPERAKSAASETPATGDATK
jgi:predicted site-specific integrase-resolvase